MRPLLLLPLLLAMGQPPRVSGASVTIALPPPLPALPLPPVAGPAGRPLILIDPGHGGHDPGARGVDGAEEKAVTLALAQTVRGALLAGGRVRVALTRSGDRFLTLRERAVVAEALKADLLLSIHADSAPNSAATGATLYTLSARASDAQAAAVAKRENRADIVAGVDLGVREEPVAAILSDLDRRRTSLRAARFAQLTRREAGESVPFRPDYLRHAAFAVLRAKNVPAVLVEAGYLTSAVDEQRLRSTAGQQALAAALTRAAQIYAAEVVER